MSEREIVQAMGMIANQSRTVREEMERAVEWLLTAALELPEAWRGNAGSAAQEALLTMRKKMRYLVDQAASFESQCQHFYGALQEFLLPSADAK